MKASPLQLLRYFVPEIACTANQDFDMDKEFELPIEQFQVTTNLRRSEQEKDDEEANSWLLEMSIIQQIAPKQNFPYEFKLNIVGLFNCN
jgi:lysyl-tRNA synthetase class I